VPWSAPVRPPSPPPTMSAILNEFDRSSQLGRKVVQAQLEERCGLGAAWSIAVLLLGLMTITKDGASQLDLLLFAAG